VSATLDGSAHQPGRMARETLARSMSEAQLTESVRDYCTGLRLRRAHTYNSRRSPAGWVDEVIGGPRGVIFRELKTATGKVTPEQQAWIDLLARAGMDVAVWRPADLLSGRIITELRAIA
jgi:hypothetical protein